MGYQQTFLKMESQDALIEEFKNYEVRNNKSSEAKVYGVVESITGIYPFHRGELAIVVGGERWCQRDPFIIEEELGIENVLQTIFIDSVLYCDLAKDEGLSLSWWLDENFRQLNEDELDELLK